MRRTVTLLSLLVMAVAAAPAPAAVAAALDVPQLERLRDKLAAAAPVGSSAYFDPDTATVVLQMPGTLTASVRNAMGRNGAQVRVRQGAPAAAAMAQVKGGMYMQTAYNERSCSTGFLARGNGWYWIITAAHCVAGGQGPTAIWFTQGGHAAGGLIGTGTIAIPNLGRDFGAIMISQVSPHTYLPAVATNSGGAIGITVAAHPSGGRGGQPGTPICRQGAATGHSCGVVTRTNVTVNFHSGVVTGLIEATACAQRGDSGGPLYSMNEIMHWNNGNPIFHREGYGMLAGGSIVACSDPSFRTYYSPLVDALAHYGLTMVTA